MKQSVPSEHVQIKQLFPSSQKPTQMDVWINGLGGRNSRNRMTFWTPIKEGWFLEIKGTQIRDANPQLVSGNNNKQGGCTMINL